MVRRLQLFTKCFSSALVLTSPYKDTGATNPKPTIHLLSVCPSVTKISHGMELTYVLVLARVTALARVMCYSCYMDMVLTLLWC